MMKNLLLKDKKGVSLMIGYVLLIIIAISLSIAVYSFLVLYLPSEEPKCPKDIKMVVEGVECSPGGGSDKRDLKVTVSNRGLFAIRGVFIRVGDKNRIHKELVNEGAETQDIHMQGNISKGLLPGVHVTLPDEGDNEHYEITNYDSSKAYEIEIEPFIINEENGHYVLCAHNLVTKPLSC